MIRLPEEKTFPELVERIGSGRVKVWCTPSATTRFRAMSPWPVENAAPDLSDVDWLVAVGGGSLLDAAKLLRHRSPSVKLAAVPTLWGSGAEASPIAVWTENGEKKFLMEAALLPDVVCHVPEFSESLSPRLVEWACGDAWSHALEGFLSPLASDGTRADLAEVIRGMMELGIRNDPRWFQSSALACAGQSQSSVGLIHGIAHVAEGPTGLGHARLCSTLLLPVMRFNQTKSPKWALLAARGLSGDEILEIVATLFCKEDYAQAIASLSGRWNAVLRNPCTRTNSALVRPDDKTYFEEFAP
jgi:alcohol dehydrogenase class IV